MLHLTIAADRIDCWVRRHIVPCDAPSNVNGARDRYVGLHAIGKSLRDQYDSLAAPVPPPLAALVKQLDEAPVMPTRRAISFNHLVSAGEQRRRYLKAERPGSRHIDD